MHAPHVDLAPDDRPPFAAPAVTALAALFLIAHLATVAAGAYEFHRDELLYLAMGQHLRLWRMDFPPGIALIAQTLRATVGDSLLAVRAVPALASSLLVVLAALLAREMGGGRYAQALAAVAVIANPLFMRAGALFQPVVLDQVTWTLGYLALARWRRTDDPRWWIGVGAAGGLGLLCKFSVVFFGFGVLVAVAVLPERRVLRTVWPWAAALLALVVGSPSLVGQVRLGGPVFGQMHDLRATQLARSGPAEFLQSQLLMGPGVLLAVLGVIGLFWWAPLRRWRVVGLACLVPFATLLLSHGKGYYAGPVFPTLFAAGACWVERRAGGRRRSDVVTRAGAVGVLAAYGLLVLPVGFPVLPPEPMARYARAMGLTAVVRTNVGEMLPLPQDYADMLGWSEQARAIAAVYHALSPAEQNRAVLVAGNYGEAGAVDYYASRYGMPGVVSPAGSYWFFGPGDRPGDVTLVLSGSAETRPQLERLFERVTPAAIVTNRWGVPEEQRVTVWRCDGPRQSLQQVWPSLAGQN